LHLEELGERVKMQKQSNYVKALIQIMYDHGDINKATYEKVMQKLKKEIEKHGKNK